MAEAVRRARRVSQRFRDGALATREPWKVSIRAGIVRAVKHTVTLEIAGAKYRMTSDAEPGHLERLAEVVNQRVSALGAKAARNASPAQLLAVVALGLADDLLSAEERRKRVEELTRTTVARTIERIDRRLGGSDRAKAE
jgi:cell division protein ZapA